MQIIEKDSKILIEIDKDEPVKDVILNFIKELRKKRIHGKEISEDVIEKLSEEVKQSYWDNFLQKFLKEKGIIA